LLARFLRLRRSPARALSDRLTAARTIAHPPDRNARVV
jgi:hypothetical protein